MNWFVLLIPLALLPIVLLFVFVGCSLDTTPTGAGPSINVRQLSLEYEVPKIGPTPITQIDASFTVWSGKVPATVFPSTPQLVTFDSNGLAQGVLSPVSVELFDAGEPIWCRCQATVSAAVSGQAPKVIATPDAQTPLPTKDDVLTFTLTYNGWASDQDYNAASFNLYFENQG